MGYACLTFVTGALAFWLPKFTSELMHVDVEYADVAIGGVTVVAGLGGTFVGGLVGDRLLSKARSFGAVSAYMQVYIQMKACAITILLVLPCLVCDVMTSITSSIWRF